VTNDIAIGLRIPFEAAEKIKRTTYAPIQKFDEGTLFEEVGNDKDFINLADYGVEDGAKIARTDLNTIIEARLTEIFEHVVDEIKKAGQEGLLAGGAILTGGGALLAGVTEVAKETLRLPARIGKATSITGLAENIDSPQYAVPVGLLMWGIRQRERQDLVRVSPVQVWFNAFGRVKDWVKRSFFP
jgi:cell division protein FtsA